MENKITTKYIPFHNNGEKEPIVIDDSKLSVLFLSTGDIERKTYRGMSRVDFTKLTADLDADIVVDDIQYSIKMFYKLALDFISHTPYGVNQFAIQCVMKKGVILFNLNLIEAYSLDDTRFNRHFGYDKESAGTLHFRETIDASLGQLFK
jgi:hypothetical protein